MAKWFMLIMPIVVPFYESNGLSLQDIMTLKAVYSIAVVAMEIPSGYFADFFGRKNTMIIGSILGTLGFVCYGFSYGFWGFLIAELVLGLGQSLISGADSALLYDTLALNRRSSEYAKFEGRIISIGNFSEAIAGIMGGLLATYSLRTPYYVQAFVAFIAIPASLTLREPERVKDLGKMAFSKVLSVVRFSLFEDPRIRINILFSAIIGTATLTMAWFVQPYFQEIHIPLALFGVLWTILNLSVGISSIFSHKIEKRLGKKRSLLLISIWIPLSYLLIGLWMSWYALILLLLFYLVRGLATPVLKDYINRITSSDIRATVLSVRNFIIRILFAILAPALGWASDRFSLSMALFTAGTVFLLLALATYILYLRCYRGHPYEC